MKDLEGAKVGVPALGGAAEFLTRGIFEQAGMDQESATLMATQQSAMLSSLDGQQIDAAWVTEPSVTMGVESGIAVQPFTVGGDDGPPDMKWGSMGLVAARKFVEEDPEPFCKVKQAYQEAVDFIRDPANKDAVVEVMTAEMNLEPAMAEAVLDRNEDLYFPESIDVSAERYDPAFAFLGEMGIAKKSYTTDDYAMEVCT
jgi:NitT/TauT family transport system substrate-binding protein